MNRSRHALLVPLALAALVAGCDGGRPTTETFTWKGPVSPDGWLRLRNVSGDVEIRQGTGDSAVIQLEIERSNRRAPTAQVRVLQLADGVIACVLYGDGGTCSTDGYRGGNTSTQSPLAFLRGNTSVHGTITLPRGVRLDAESTNGDIDVEGVSGTMQLMTVNGDVDVRGASGALKIATTNGDIDLGLDAIGGGLNIATTNGDVQVELPTTLNAALSMTTTNGELNLGFAGNITTKTARQILATLGSGGVPITIATTNGDIALRPRATQ